MTRLAPPSAVDAAPHAPLAQAMLDALPGRVCVVDAEGRVRHANAAWHTLGASGWGQVGEALLAGPGGEPAVADTVRDVLDGRQAALSQRIDGPPGPALLVRASRLQLPGLDGALVSVDDVPVADAGGDAALQRVRAAMGRTSDAISLVDRTTLQFIDVNEAACRLRRCSHADMLALGPARVLGIAPEALAAVYDRVIAAGETVDAVDAVDTLDAAQPVEWSGHHAGGGRLYVEIRRRALRTASGWVILGVTRDITARKLAEKGMQRAARQQGLIARFGRAALARLPLPDLFTQAAAVAAEGLNIEFAEVSACSPDSGVLRLSGSVGFDDGDSRPSRLAANVLAAGTPVAVRTLATDLPGGCARLGRHGVTSALAVPLAGCEGPRGALLVASRSAWRFGPEQVDFLQSVANTLATAVDRVEAESRLTQLTQFDVLTGLPNRTLVLDRLSQALAQGLRHGWRVDVMLLDLDRFKNVNETLGHAAGDELLVQAGRRLSACVRSSDTVGRLGGDEFAIVLPQPDDAATVAKRVMAAMAEPFRVAGQEVYVSASIGIGVYPADGPDAHTLLKNADTAMNHAKQRGRNTFVFYVPQMNDQAASRLRLEAQLRTALERGEFLLHYQPKVNLSDGEISGFEALLRWQHPQLGMVPPLDFIAILEDTGLIVPVGEWVLRTVCRQLAQWRAQGLALRPVAINLSARQFQERGLDDVVRAIVAEEGVDPSLLEFELTESMLMADADAAVRTLAALKAYGVRLSVDDFGTGYSSLSYLKRFPLDALKIDRSFMRDVTTDSDDASIALAIIRLAHSLRLDVVAEGVETRAQLRFLQTHDCDQMQGYLFRKPLPVEDCTRALRERHRLAEDGAAA